MAAAILIFLWIGSQLNYDQFHKNKDRIYEVWNNVSLNGVVNNWATTPKILATALEKDIPEVERAVRVDFPSIYLLNTTDKKLKVSGYTVDTGFLKMFTYPLVQGNIDMALNSPSKIIITEDLSKKLFGSEDAMGKTIRLENKDYFTVSGILKNPPANSRFKFEFLLPWSYLIKQGNNDSSWGNNSTTTYVQLKEKATLKNVDEKIAGIKYQYTKSDDAKNWKMFLYPIKKWRLYSRFENGIESGGLISFVKMFGVIGIFILLIACINFMNLSTARSQKRAKEVGVRKAAGATQGNLVGQFIAESVLLALLAGLIALIIVKFSLPGFSNLIDEKLQINLTDFSFWIKAIIFILFTGVLTGCYPALFMAAFKPITVLKGSINVGKGHVTPRKLLVVFQFTFSIVLIICTIIVKKQIDYTKNRQAGFNKNNLVYHNMSGDIEKNYPLIKNELLQSGAVTSVSKTQSPLTESWSNSFGFTWQGKDENDKTVFDRFRTDEDLGTTAGLTFVKGRDFDLKQFPTDSTGMIINESALKVMGFKDPLGQIVMDGEKSYHIVGVIKDFIIQSPYQPTNPMLILGAKGWLSVINFKLNAERSTSQNLNTIESVFKKYNPNFPFDYKFVDKEYELKFKAEERTGILAGLFATLAIIISCLGLLGLATYMAESRKKEIGIRKVLGATTINIAKLLSSEFLVLVVISLFIASPVAWGLMQYWLKNYDYRVSIGWQIFALAGIASIAIAVITVSFQAIKAALANPIKSLRTE